MADEAKTSRNLKLLDDSREVILDATVQRLRMVWELKQAKQPLLPEQPRRAPYPMEASPGLEDLLFDAARLAVGNANEWVKLGNTHFDRIAAMLRSLSGASAPNVPSPAEISLELKGIVGQMVKSKSFRVQNPFRDPVDIVFTHPFFWRDEDGGAGTEKHFMAEVKLELGAGAEPALPPVIGLPFRIAPLREAQLVLAVTLTSPLFKDGSVYKGEARLLSQGRLGGRVSLTIDMRGQAG